MKTPSLLLNSEIAKSNIQKMNAFCHEKQMDFRPHFKTHQSKEIGKWFRAKAIHKCTVSSLDMALYFAEDGWTDICIAIPLNINEMGKVSQLAKRVKLSLCVDHLDSLRSLGKLKSQIDLFIEIDTGYGRSGVHFGNTNQIDDLIKEIELYHHLNFTGFLSHTGNSYASLNPEQGSRIFEEARKQLLQLKQSYQQGFPHLILSMGDTPSSAFGKDFTGIDEWRPGNFVFCDFMQYALGSCKEEEIAVSVFCPVIGIYPERSEIVIYGGGVHLSKDNIEFKGQKIYGWLRPKAQSIKKGFPIVSLSQEHGIIKASGEFLRQLKIGDFVEIIPVHSCMTADLNSGYLTETGNFIPKFRTFSSVL